MIETVTKAPAKSSIHFPQYVDYDVGNVEYLIRLTGHVLSIGPHPGLA